MKERKEFRKLCFEKESKTKEIEIAEIKNTNTKKKVWQYINKYRKSRSEISKDIPMEKWCEHFRLVLNGEQANTVGDWNREEDKDEEKEEDLTDEEITKQIRKLKRKKATGEDGIPNEAWVFAQSNTQQEICNLMQRIWHGEGIPEDWKIGLVAPLHKKGDKETVENYRGIALLNTAYKIYAMILNDRLLNDIDGKRIHAVEKELAKEKGKESKSCTKKPNAK